MRGLNKVTLIGNLGKDPELQQLEGNLSLVKVPIATSETYKDRDGKSVTQTEWHTVILWRKLAELAHKYLQKGSLVYIEGKLKNRAWEDKNGNKKFVTEIIADHLLMLDKPTNNASSSANTNEFDDENASNFNPNDNLPF